MNFSSSVCYCFATVSQPKKFRIKVEVDGATLNVEVDGPAHGPNVLLWHGAGCTLRMWDFAVERLIDKFRFIRFDVRGMGLSSETEDPETQYTFEQYADDANQILDACAAAQCHVWSMAWGSRAALAYCSLNPSRVLSAAFYDASIGAADVKAQQQGGKKAVGLQLQAGIERFPKPKGWNVHNTPELVPQALAAAAKFNLPEAVTALTMPVLVATGDHDPNLASSRDLVDRALNARLEVLENVGHGSVLQRPDLTAKTFMHFQESLGSLDSKDN